MAKINPKKGEKWRHFKGTLYVVDGVTTPGKCPYSDTLHSISVTHTETGVVYQSFFSPTVNEYRIWLWPEVEESFVLYRQDLGSTAVWARPLNNFMATVHRDGKSFPRFAKEV